MRQPKIIQGGMGVGVSSWPLARAVSQKGQIGVVSGVALDVVHARRLNDGDPGGHLRRIYEGFPVPGVAERVLSRYYREGGRPPGTRYPNMPEFEIDPPPELVDLTVLANYAEVALAKEGHDGMVGINYLEKIQLPTLCSLYGAMLAGVDVVLMGAGIPKEIPHILDEFAAGRPATYRISVAGASPQDKFEARFDPADFGGTTPVTPLARPQFLAIIASNALASFLAKSVGGRPDGFVVEGPTAGGHNAPPRGALVLDEAGDPVYGPRDDVNVAALAALGLPFWLAGGYGSPERLREALDVGAAGIQVGSAFALCEESSIDPSLKREIVANALEGTLRTRTDSRASPSGYPFKVAELEDTISNPEVYAARTRVCDLGYLRSAYVNEDGTVGYRCPAEPVAAHVRKGGTREDTEGRNCLCNGLLATIGLAQLRRGVPEPPIVTAGDDLERAVRALAVDGRAYSASDVVDYLLD